MVQIQKLTIVLEAFCFLIYWLGVYLYGSEGLQSSSQLGVLSPDEWIARLVVKQ